MDDLIFRFNNKFNVNLYNCNNTNDNYDIFDVEIKQKKQNCNIVIKNNSCKDTIIFFCVNDILVKKYFVEKYKNIYDKYFDLFISDKIKIDIKFYVDNNFENICQKKYNYLLTKRFIFTKKNLNFL